MDELGGYRLVRLLGSGKHADVYLGRPVSNQQGEAVAVKRYRLARPPEQVGREVEALCRVQSRHIVALRDLTRDDAGQPVLILDRHGPMGLSAMLRSRTSLSDGEAVTALAPIVGAVSELHRAGIAHGGIGAGAVLFDRAGAPVLIGFGACELVGERPAGPRAFSLPPVHSATNGAYVRDRAAVAALVRSVLELAGPTSDAASVIDWMTGACASSRADRFLPDLVDRLFDLAPACAIGGMPGAATDGAIGVREPERPGRPDRPDGVAIATAVPPTGAMRTGPGVPGRSGLLRRSSHPFAAVRRAATKLAVSERVAVGITQIRAVRRPVWVAAGTAAVLLLAAVLFLPAESPAEGRGASMPDPPISEAHTAETSTSDPPPAQSSPSPTPDTGHDPVVGEDPVAAATELLHRRAACYESESIVCLTNVDHAGSAILDADEWAIRAVQEGSEVASALVFAPPTLVERMGDSALLTTTQPAGEPIDAPPNAAPAAPSPSTVTILLVRGEDGWRLRDVIDDVG